MASLYSLMKVKKEFLKTVSLVNYKLHIYLKYYLDFKFSWVFLNSKNRLYFLNIKLGKHSLFEFRKKIGSH